MNKFIQAIQNLDHHQVQQLLARKPGWVHWSEKTGKNALHFLGDINVLKAPEKAAPVLEMAQLLLEKGIDINAIHRIDDKNCIFPATALWHTYTRGRNKLLYTYLLENGSNPDHCLFAIAWNDDVEAAELFKRHGAKIGNDEFLAAFYWKRYQMVAWFLKNGADVNYIGPEGYSALLLAVKRKLPAGQVQLLLNYGADWNKENNAGLSPKKLAEANRQRGMLKLFV